MSDGVEKMLRYLSDYELAILYTIAIGWSYRQIAMHLKMDKQAARVVIHSIYNKLHVKTSKQAIPVAIKLGYLK